MIRPTTIVLHNPGVEVARALDTDGDHHVSVAELRRMPRDAQAAARGVAETQESIESHGTVESAMGMTACATFGLAVVSAYVVGSFASAIIPSVLTGLWVGIGLLAATALIAIIILIVNAVRSPNGDQHTRDEQALDATIRDSLRAQRDAAALVRDVPPATVSLPSPRSCLDGLPKI